MVVKTGWPANRTSKFAMGVVARNVIPDHPGLGFTPNYDQLKDARIEDPKHGVFAGRDTHEYLLRKKIDWPEQKLKR
jgi:hypothetical protein